MAEIMQSEAQPRVLVIDDDPEVRTTVRNILEYAGYAVCTAGDGLGGLQVAAEAHPDLIVLDLILPDLDGLTVCMRLRQQTTTPIVLLTGRATVRDRVRGFDAGADDYVVKPFALEELLARVRAVLRRCLPAQAGADVLTFQDLSLDLSTYSCRRGTHTAQLSDVECRLLELFLRHPRQVLTRTQLLERIWGPDFEGTSNILEVYIYHLRGKVEAGGQSRLIQTVRGVGYVLRS